MKYAFLLLGFLLQNMALSAGPEVGKEITYRVKTVHSPETFTTRIITIDPELEIYLQSDTFQGVTYDRIFETMNFEYLQAHVDDLFKTCTNFENITVAGMHYPTCKVRIEDKFKYYFYLVFPHLVSEDEWEQGWIWVGHGPYNKVFKTLFGYGAKKTLYEVTSFN